MPLDLAELDGFKYRRTTTKIYTAEALSQKQRHARQTKAERDLRLRNIAVLDFETDPFDKEDGFDDPRRKSMRFPNEALHPFAACLYSKNFSPIIVWDNDFKSFVDKVLGAIEDLPEKYTIYAHNGGKFDYMFLIHKLRGTVRFKGRGLMSAKIGALQHDLRDSFHIIPEKLANFQKDAFDYRKLLKCNREKHKAEIIRYMTNDCKYLLSIVIDFVSKFGLKLSIGMAAIAKLKEEYDVDRITEQQDKYLRQYYFGGRVECVAGKGIFSGKFKHYDINSAYPHAMSALEHPVGNGYTIRTEGSISEDTFFLKLNCTNYGAFVRRAKDEPGKNVETHAFSGSDGSFDEATHSSFAGEPTRGEFFVTIHEYRVAMEFHLIDDVQILHFVDCNRKSNFSRFITPLYGNRLRTKAAIQNVDRRLRNDEKLSSAELVEYYDTKKDDIFYKLLQNNCYGKFCQNPENFREHYITDRDEIPLKPVEKGSTVMEQDMSYGERPEFICDDYCIWSRPSPGKRYFNVGTGASITGAVRARILRAIATARNPIYCDTDSLICEELRGEMLSHTELGAWTLENEFDEVIICGKKTYAGKFASQYIKQGKDGKPILHKLRSKGANELTWTDYETMLAGDIVSWLNKGVTLTKTGDQYYMRRNLRATATRKRLAVTSRMEALANG